jgi:hypothetical protein
MCLSGSITGTSPITPNYYSVSPDSNPQGPDTDELWGLRGGSWSNDGDNIRSANRGHFPSDLTAVPFQGEDPSRQAGVFLRREIEGMERGGQAGSIADAAGSRRASSSSNG